MQILTLAKVNFKKEKKTRLNYFAIESGYFSYKNLTWDENSHFNV